MWTTAITRRPRSRTSVERRELHTAPRRSRRRLHWTRPDRALIAVAVAAILAAPLAGTDLAPPGPVVISEILYNPPGTLGDDESFEFVELHNRSTATVDLDGWILRDRDDAHAFTVEGSSPLEPGGYLVLARDLSAFWAVVGPDVAALGDVGFPLGNGGDTVRLFDSSGALVDQVIFSDQPPWPFEADGLGSTLERIDVSADITDFSNFAPSAPADPPGTPGRANSAAGPIPRRHGVVINEIMYNPVRDPDGDPLRHCRDEEFIELHNRGDAAIDVGGWRFVSGIDVRFPAGTVIDAGGYLVVAADRAAFEAKYGAVSGIVGPWEGALDDGGESILLVDDGGLPVDHVDYNDRIPWPINPDGLRGSIELIDPSSDNDRARAWAESSDFDGTPGRINSATEAASARGAGPQITRVTARPATEPARESVRSSDAVRVEARVLDRDGVSRVLLHYQVCVAGDYIRITDDRFTTDWVKVPMEHDTSRGVHAVDIPVQPHRTLVRYRVEAFDGGTPAAAAMSPRERDPEPNYAYFVHDGIPEYVADQRSAFGAPGYAHTDLDRVPVYFFIADAADIEEVQYRQFPIDSVYRWRVTVVHDNRVYDHCRLRLRTGHRYTWPKRPWKIRLNKGNFFRGHYDDGTPFPRGRSRINLSTAQHDPGKPRGEGGVFESLAFRLFHEAGVLSSATNFVHLRIVRSAEEHGQFDGDFFGLYVDLQRIDTVLLEDRGLPSGEDSEIYKMAGRPIKKHPDCDPSLASVRALMEGHLPQPREWYEEHLDLEKYFSFRAVVELADAHDMDSLKNFFYYHNGETGRWQVVPWDLDNTFGATSSGDEPFHNRVLPLYPIESKNRLRFLRQVQYDEKRIFSIIDRWSEQIASVADADQDRWDTEPRQACPRWPSVAGANCIEYAPFRIRMRNLKSWIRTRTGLTSSLVLDASIPHTPSNVQPAPRWPAAQPVVLGTSPFSDPDSESTHAATRWLVIERDGDWMFPLHDVTSEEDLLETTLPVDIVENGREYLFRAAHRDDSGRWGLLSEPTPFIVGPSDPTPPSAPSNLRAVSVSSRAVTVAWAPASDPQSGIFGYRLLRDGAPISARLATAERSTDFSPLAGSHEYRVVAVNRAGIESAPSAPIVVAVASLAAIGGWGLPAGGLEYFYDADPGEDVYVDDRSFSAAFALDGSWARARDDDWDGSRPGEALTAPGGVGVQVIDGEEGAEPTSVLSLEDPGDPSLVLPSPNNRRLYLLRAVSEDARLIDDGITLIARLRVNPDPLDLDVARGQTPERSKMRGQVGVATRAGRERRNFSLWLDGGALHVSGGASLELDTETFHSVWTTVRREGDGHRVQVFLDGGLEPALDALVDLPTVGTESSVEGTYLQMGLSNVGEPGAIQIDYFGYAAGVKAPRPEGAAGWFVRGDANGDGEVEIDDAISILEWLFVRVFPLDCPDAADVDDSGRIDVTDVIALLEHLFRAGAPPSEPHPEPGGDATRDRLPGCLR